MSNAIILFLLKNFDPQMLLITVAFIGLMLLVLILGIWKILIPVFVRALQLGSSRKTIESLRSKDEKLSTIRRNLIGTLFKKAKWAEPGFKAFRLAWEESRPNGADKAILPIRLREYLPHEVVLEGVRNRRIADALPGIFVSLGILGTFLGLVLGLTGLELDKLDQLQDGVAHLVSGLSVSFYTSLFGISFSILFSFFDRLTSRKLERRFLELDDMLCSVYPFDSHERYARRHYELQADVKQGLQTLATDVATQITDHIGPKLGEALETHLVPVLKDLHMWIQRHMEDSKSQQDAMYNGFNEHMTRLSKVITQHFEDSQERQSETIEAVLQHYASALTDNFQSHFMDMGNIIKQTTDAQIEIKEHLANFSEQLTSQFEVQADLIDKTNRAGEILGQSLDSLESIAVKLKSSADDITSAASLLESSAQSAKEGQDVLRETMQQQIDTMTETRQELEGIWASISQGSQTMIANVRQVINELSTGVGDNMVKALDSFDGKVAEVVERFSGTLFEAGQTIEEMPALINQLDSHIRSIGESFNSQKTILLDLKDMTQSMVPENLMIARDAAGHLSESTEKIATTTAEIQSLYDNVSNKLGAALEHIRQIAQNRPQNDSTNNALPTALNKKLMILTESLGSLSNNLASNRNGDIAKALLYKITNIDNQLKDLSTSVKKMKPYLDAIDSVVGKISNEFLNAENLSDSNTDTGKGKKTILGRIMGK